LRQRSKPDGRDAARGSVAQPRERGDAERRAPYDCRNSSRILNKEFTEIAGGMIHAFWKAGDDPSVQICWRLQR
jgi:hypothetical protein